MFPITQPWAAARLLGPSSTEDLLEEISSLSKRDQRVKFKKSMEPMLSTFLRLFCDNFLQQKEQGSREPPSVTIQF